MVSTERTDRNACFLCGGKDTKLHRFPQNIDRGRNRKAEHFRVPLDSGIVLSKAGYLATLLRGGPILIGSCSDIFRLKVWLINIGRSDILRKQENIDKIVKARLCNNHFSDWCFTDSFKMNLIRYAEPFRKDPPEFGKPTQMQESERGVSSELQASISDLTENPGTTLTPLILHL